MRTAESPMLMKLNWVWNVVRISVTITKSLGAAAEGARKAKGRTAYDGNRPVQHY